MACDSSSGTLIDIVNEVARRRLSRRLAPMIYGFKKLEDLFNIVYRRPGPGPEILYIDNVVDVMGFVAE